MALVWYNVGTNRFRQSLGERSGDLDPLRLHEHDDANALGDNIGGTLLSPFLVYTIVAFVKQPRGTAPASRS